MFKLLCVLAHPDDESLALGGTIAKYSSLGVETSLIVATRGERGWRGHASQHPGEQMLGQIREQEVRQASQALGIAHLLFLDYMDGDLDQANEFEATAQITRLIRQLRPDIVLTFGPDGLYGHPDHIAISQFTTSAIVCAADIGYAPAFGLEPHRVSKLYYRTATRDWLETYMPIFGELIMQIDGQERRAQSWTNWAITTRLDTSSSWLAVWQAVCCHRTQIPAEQVLRQLSEEDHYKLWGTQEYYRAYSLVNGGRREESDIFEGLLMPGLWNAQLPLLASVH
ncbi:MAG TPA: PIG-L family deacetylase [Ktedonobacteraceae bacterium]